MINEAALKSIITNTIVILVHMSVIGYSLLICFCGPVSDNIKVVCSLCIFVSMITILVLARGVDRDLKKLVIE